MSKLSRLVSLSRESETTIGDEEALNDTSVHTDIVTDVEMPAQEIVDTSDEIMEAQEEAQSLEETAEMIDETTEEGGQGIDPLAAELVQEKIETAVEKYQLSIRRKALSRESFNTVSSRREVSRQLAREAEEASKGIWERIKEAFKSAVAWLKNLLKNWLTSQGRLHQRIKALKTKYDKLDETDVDPSNVDMSASRLGATNVVDEVNKLKKFVESRPFEWFNYVNLDDAIKDAKTSENYQHLIDAITKKSKLKNNVNLFEDVGGKLGGKEVRFTVRDNSGKYFQMKVTDTSNELKDTKLKGVTKREGVSVLEILDKTLSNFNELKDDVSTAVINTESAITAMYKANNPGESTTLVRAALLPYVMCLRKVASIGLSTSMKVASVATEVCAKSIKVSKEKDTNKTKK